MLLLQVREHFLLLHAFSNFDNKDIVDLYDYVLKIFKKN